METDDARQRLAEERARLETMQHALDEEHLHDESGADSTSELSHVAQHQADVATETFEREKDLGILDQVEAELADVERALSRLDAGTYGRCDACGEPITDERLAALPAARFCIRHQAQSESG
jgi:RNA polymerase-binding transcription factor DksA